MVGALKRAEDIQIDDPEAGDMESKETPVASSELTNENIHAVIVTQGRLEQGEVVNLAMTESTALRLYHEWMETLPNRFEGAVRPLQWAQERNLPVDTHAEAETIR